MRRLVAIALEEFGPDLNRTRFNEVMLALFDQIAGLGPYPANAAGSTSSSSA